MKLLFLGSIILIILLFVSIKYLNIKNKEGISNINKSDTSDKQSNMLRGQHDYYKIRSKGAGTGILTVDDNMSKWKMLDRNKNLKTIYSDFGLEQSIMDKRVQDCSKLNSCGDLENSNCGYCASTKTFSTGDKNGPSNTVCPKGEGGMNMWSKTSTECSKIKERSMCGKIKSCGDLYGDAENVCGYCPTSGRIMPMKKVGNKLVPKFSEDTCTSSKGLVKGSDCQKFAKDHPCITPYHESGSHSKACIKKLWKNSGCTREKPMGSTFEHLVKVLKKPYKQIGDEMKNIYNKTFGNNYDEAKHNSILCYNNTNNLNPCDAKYSKKINGIDVYPNDCYKIKFLESGCDKNGKGWKDIQNNLIKQVLTGKHKTNIYGGKMSTMPEYTSKLKKINDTALKGSSGSSSLYEIKKNAANECYGKIPPPPPPIKVGDRVSYEKSNLKFEGIVTRKSGSKLGVLWVLIKDRIRNTIIKDRKNTSINDQRKFFGWPTIKATNSNYSVGDVYGFVLERDVIAIDRCGTAKSKCKMSCRDIVNDIKVKYPMPRDCIVGSYGSWGKCTKYCGGGTQVRTRPILYKAKYGGADCPALSQTRVCNTHTCTNPNFDERNKYTGPNIVLKQNRYGCPKQTFYKKGWYWEGKNRKLIPRGDRYYCCTNTWCSRWRGGWFSHFAKTDGILEHNNTVIGGEKRLNKSECREYAKLTGSSYSDGGVWNRASLEAISRPGGCLQIGSNVRYNNYGKKQCGSMGGTSTKCLTKDDLFRAKNK